MAEESCLDANPDVYITNTRGNYDPNDPTYDSYFLSLVIYLLIQPDENHFGIQSRLLLE